MADADHAQPLAVDTRHETDDFAGAMSSAAITPFLVFATMSPVATRTLQVALYITPASHTGPGAASPALRFLR